MESIGVRLDKRKLSLIFLVLLVFSIISFCFLLYPESFTSTQYDSTEFIRIIGLVGGLLFVPVLVILGKKIGNPQFGLLINEEGIVDNGTGSSIGLVAWDDIIRLQMVGVPASKMLLIIVREPKKYINQVNSRLARGILILNSMVYGSPIVIPTRTLRIDVDDLEREVMEALKKRRKR
ncbi:MAG: hypothetical protein ACI976_000062 [Aureispira sp.]|jgi:hypothetical protein